MPHDEGRIDREHPPEADNVDWEGELAVSAPARGKRGVVVTIKDAARFYLSRGRFLKGVIFGEQKKTEEAIRIYTALTHDHPDLPEPYNNLAVLHAALGQYEPARLALETAIRVKPDYAVAHENLGDIYARMAAQAYEKASRLDRRNASAPVKLRQVTEMLSSGVRR